MNGRYLVIDLVDGGSGHRTVVLQGDLDSSTAGEFDDRVSQGCPAWKGDAVVVDLSGLEYISSAGVRSLLRLERMLGAGALHLEGATGIVRDVLETTGILQPEDPWAGGSEEEVPDRASMVEVAVLRVVADPERIPEILDFIGDMASSYGLSQEDSLHLRLAMEEILTSVFSYGYGNDRIHSADVVIAVGEGVDELELVVEHASPDQRMVPRPVEPSQEVADEPWHQVRRRGEVDELASGVHADTVVAETARVHEDVPGHHAVGPQKVADIHGVEGPDRRVAVEGVPDLLDLTAASGHNLAIHEVSDVFQRQAVVLYGGGGLHGSQPVFVSGLRGFQSLAKATRVKCRFDLSDQASASLVQCERRVVGLNASHDI